jgi:hypothetical protein
MGIFVGNRSGTKQTLDKDEAAYHKSQSEIAYYRYLQNKALEWIREHPFEFLSLTAHRIWRFWVVIPG